MDTELVELLLIEDNHHEAELTIRNLKKSKLANNMLHIDDGEEALDFMFNEGQYSFNEGKVFNPKLILLDLKLPKISGIEILRKIKKDPRTQNIPVVILTSSNEVPDIDTCYNEGANSYIVKPVNFNDFSKLIGDLGMYWIITNKQPNPAMEI
ncbi:response regulator [Fulvivirga maritima]|uniref:response regulator n=1 Tax=Fulvivirga maritima TaxID=2904247 RepID=UPI001F1EB9C4|nr:response regulator [Fulvivirga maritima]UII26590.1 response regulator [Fulvivirga maritima]